MKKFLLVLLYGVMIFMPMKSYNQYEDIQTSFQDSYQIELLVDNKSYSYNKGSKEYYHILLEFEKMIIGSYQMPALGVSLDRETRESKQKGVWLEFKFDQINYNNEMPFDALLVEVKPNFYGFNIIRKYKGVYEGRCYYLNLDNKSMESLYSYLKSKSFNS